MNGKKIMKYIIFAVVLLIPIMYSFFYLKAYWDPYGNLQDLKIAMVNLDEGKDGTNQGEKLVNKMVENGTFKICDVSEEQAEDGLVNGEYYAVIKIPKNFTEDLNSAQDEEKRLSTITYSPNQKSNYLASQIINSAIKTMELNLHSEVAKTITENLTDKLEEVPESLGDIVDGATQLEDGAQELNSGTKEVQNGAKNLNQGATKLNTGANKLSTGASSLSEGTNNLANGADSIQGYLKQLSDGIYDTKEGYKDLDSGIKEITSTLGALKTKMNAIASKTENLPQLQAANKSALTTLENKNKEIKQNYEQSFASYLGGKKLENITDTEISVIGNTIASNYSVLGATEAGKIGKTYAGLLKTLRDSYKGNLQLIELTKSNQEAVTTVLGLLNSDDLKKLTSEETTVKLQKLTQGSSQMTETLNTLQENVNKIYNGSKDLSKGANSLKQGATTLEQGAKELSSGTNTLSSGTQALYTGTEKLQSGSETLVDGTKEFKTEVSNGLEDTNKELVKLNGLANFAENPVEIKQDAYGEINQYGLSFTPLFLSIGLWVGSLMAYVVLYYDQDKRYKLLGRYATNKLVQIALYLGIAVIQGLVTGILLKAGLGLTVTSNTLYYFTCIFTSVVFMSIIQFLIMNFGDIGKFLALVILVLQLAASGGTFPIQTVSKEFQFLNPILPMTYTIKLIKESVMIIDKGFALKNIGILSLYLIIPLAITTVVQIIKKRKNVENS